MLIIISFVLLGCMIGMIIDRHFLLKFYLCYETCFFTISVIMLLCSCEINEIILVLYFLWNTTFEVVLGLSVLWVFHELCPFIYSLLPYLLSLENDSSLSMILCFLVLYSLLKRRLISWRPFHYVPILLILVYLFRSIENANIWGSYVVYQ